MSIEQYLAMIPDEASRSRVLLLIGRFDSEAGRLRGTRTSDAFEAATLAVMADALTRQALALKGRVWEYDAGMRPVQPV